MLNAYIYDGLRSAFGRHAGALAKVRPDDMLASVMKDLMKKVPFKPEQIEDIVIGCGNQGGEDSRCVARHAGLLAGLPVEIPGAVLQRNCASGLIPLASLRLDSGQCAMLTPARATCSISAGVS